MNRFKDDLAIEKDIAKHKKYCKCGHSVVFPNNSKASKIICTHCGYYIYKNKEEEFKDRLFSSMQNKKII